jgi:DNA/RNA-binding domain of Phe-tRNA-synthetase-like protein
MLTIQLELPLQIGIIQIRSLKIRQDEEPFRQLLNCAEKYFNRYNDMPISEVPGVQEARKLFRLLGIEPTKYRPASEALLRRAIKQKPFSSVNNLVDISNWCALDFLLPNGAYDIQKLEPPIELRLGLADESYIGLTNQPVHLEKRYCLADRKGAFGSPKTDSRRSAVNSATTEALIVQYATTDFDTRRLEELTKRFSERILEYCGGEIIGTEIIPQN